MSNPHNDKISRRASAASRFRRFRGTLCATFVAIAPLFLTVFVIWFALSLIDFIPGAERGRTYNSSLDTYQLVSLSSLFLPIILRFTGVFGCLRIERTGQNLQFTQKETNRNGIIFIGLFSVFMSILVFILTEYVLNSAGDQLYVLRLAGTMNYESFLRVRPRFFLLSVLYNLSITLFWYMLTRCVQNRRLLPLLILAIMTGIMWYFQIYHNFGSYYFRHFGGLYSPLSFENILFKKGVTLPDDFPALYMSICCSLVMEILFIFFTISGAPQKRKDRS